MTDTQANTSFLVLTVIGPDRPGLVGELSALISAHAGNWLESSMSQLAGKFAGIVKIEITPEHAKALQAELAGLAGSIGLKVIAEISAPQTRAKGRHMHLSLVGHDRIGIVREVSQVLAQHAVNVEKLVTFISSAAMSAEPLFHAQADLSAASTLDPHTLTVALEKISNDLMVDLTMAEA